MSFQRASELVREAVDEVGGPRRAYVALGAAAVCVAAAWSLWGAARAAPPPEVVLEPDSGVTASWARPGGRAEASGPKSSPSGTSDPSTSAARAEPHVVVHVAGAVARPGLYRFSTGTRVGDAISRAGGARGDADLDALNLAEVLVDGRQVRVPRKGEGPTAGLASGGSGGTAGASSGGGATGSSTSGPQAQIDLNTASATELDALPGIGPVLAQRIVDHREKNGPFTSVEGLREVDGIGPKKFESLQGSLAVR